MALATAQPVAHSIDSPDYCLSWQTALASAEFLVCFWQHFPVDHEYIIWPGVQYEQNTSGIFSTALIIIAVTVHILKQSLCISVAVHTGWSWCTQEFFARQPRIRSVERWRLAEEIWHVWWGRVERGWTNGTQLPKLELLQSRFWYVLTNGTINTVHTVE